MWWTTLSSEVGRPTYDLETRSKFSLRAKYNSHIVCQRAFMRNLILGNSFTSPRDKSSDPGPRRDLARPAQVTQDSTLAKKRFRSKLNFRKDRNHTTTAQWLTEGTLAKTRTGRQSERRKVSTLHPGSHGEV